MEDMNGKLVSGITTTTLVLYCFAEHSDWALKLLPLNLYIPLDVTKHEQYLSGCRCSGWALLCSMNRKRTSN